MILTVKEFFSIDTEPHIQIVNGPEVHLHEGSTLNLTCMISPAVDASLLLWERNGQVSESTQISLDVRHNCLR